MVKNIAIGVLSVALVLVGLLYLGQKLNFGVAAGTDHYFQENMIAGLTVGDGTVVNKYKCYTDTFDPGSVSSSSVASSKAFLTPGASAGDIVFASLSSVTSTNQWFATAKITAGSGTAGATTTLYLRGTEGAAVDLATTTAKVCIVN